MVVQSAQAAAAGTAIDSAALAQEYQSGQITYAQYVKKSSAAVKDLEKAISLGKQFMAKPPSRLAGAFHALETISTDTPIISQKSKLTTARAQINSFTRNECDVDYPTAEWSADRAASIPTTTNTPAG